MDKPVEPQICVPCIPSVCSPQDRDSLQQAGVPRVEPPDAEVGRVARHGHAGR